MTWALEGLLCSGNDAIVHFTSANSMKDLRFTFIIVIKEHTGCVLRQPLLCWDPPFNYYCCVYILLSYISLSWVKQRHIS